MNDQPVILIIEDNISSQKMLRNVLEKNHYHVLEASNGTAALQILCSTKPDLIIQDLILPDMNYAELNQLIRHHQNGKNIPILALSGFLNRLEEKEYSEYFSGLLVKPVTESHLLEVVKSFFPNINLMKTEIQNHKVLIVDDNRSQIKLLNLHLSNYGFLLETAENGYEALDKIESFVPDVILSDVLMPGMDGFELCIAIKQHAKFSHIPIILMTSQYLEKSDEELAKKVSADYYITRTNDVDKLIKFINKCVNTKTTDNSVSTASMSQFKDEHSNRLIHQLEKQIDINADLSQRCALQLAHLSIFSEIANTLMDKKGVEKTLEHVLETCLDTAGISHGALYLTQADNSQLLKKMIGYNQNDEQKLNLFFNHPLLLSEINTKKDIIALSFNHSLTHPFDTLLRETNMKSAILAPLISDSQNLGILLLGSPTINVNNKDSITFTRNLTTQIGQTIALAKAIENIYFSEQRYRVLMDNASCGIFIFNQKGKVIEVNKQGEKLLNCSKEKIIQENFENFIVEADKREAALSLKKMINNTLDGPVEIRIKPFEQSQRIVEYSGVEVKMENEKVFMVATTDVSERNKLKAQTLLNDKLATVGKLAAGVAHEINNPISWVMTNLVFIKDNLSIFKKMFHTIHEITQEQNITQKLQLLESFSFGLNTQQILEFDEMINESLQGVERVRDIVKNLKGFSRMDETEITPVHIHDILNTAISMASFEFKYRARLEKHYESNLPTVWASSSKLNQVFLNLIINAAQALPDADLTKNIISVSAETAGKYIKIDISDTGTGISTDILPHIFDPFFTTKSVGHGTGLGLSICHEIISHFKGKIEVKSTLNQGSIFSVYLPIAAEVFQLPTSTHNAAENDGKRILIIDDEPYLLKCLLNILKNNYRPIAANGGHAAIALLKEHAGQFDALICDLQMPDMNGADLYHYVIAHYPELAKRIIFITGGLYSPLLKQFLTNVDNCLLEKPFAKEDLIHALENLPIQAAS